jgi:hypothetical protein
MTIWVFIFNDCDGQLDQVEAQRVKLGMTHGDRFGQAARRLFVGGCQSLPDHAESGRFFRRSFKFGAANLEPAAALLVPNGHVCFGAVVSTDRRNTGFKFLCWGLVLQGFSRSFVKLTCDGAEFSLAKARYVSAFGEVLAKQSVGIFIATALPR